MKLKLEKGLEFFFKKIEQMIIHHFPFFFFHFSFAFDAQMNIYTLPVCTSNKNFFVQFGSRMKQLLETI